ncbi:Putative component of 'biosynthetic module' [Desulfotomaculum arcticum]|uniref:Putative component of 'biosynthetic module n=1 Tax=Desulfotruncus arcticus DSM 17038 TaxID=1121424 RepID=A0A1I2PH56_9FIRM|nr:YceG family protein [Desulfotruncus arcticus]SFG14469.1 Putative component of 'biosynthetic module' [Desulfotomaculum arcticum] [Desulfotruncus arcticus DSM 17038]
MKISRNRDRQIVLKQSKDIYNDLLLPLKERPRDNGKSVFFYRIIGFNNQTEFINQTTLLHERLSNLGSLYLYFIEDIPLPFNKNLTGGINNALAVLNDIQADALCDILARDNLFPTAAAEIKGPFKTVLAQYLKNEPSVNISMVKNFVSKLLLWLHEHIPQLYQTNSPWNPKILYYGDIKKHCVYYLILLSQIGCDVLYINPCSDSDYSKVDNSNRFSMLMEGSIKVKLDHPPVKAITKPTEPVNLDALDQVVPVTGHTAVVKLKSSSDIFRDLLLPLNKRSGYLGNPAPIIPVYFYRHIGINASIDSAVDEYYNTLYRLDKTLQNKPNGFIRLTDHVAMPGNQAIALYKSKLGQARTTLLHGSEKELLINKIINAGILPATASQPLQNTIKTAFKETIDLFDQTEAGSSLSKTENFALKLIGWINKYFAALYKSFDFQDSPKILYYGNIKCHEAYLLIYLSKIGCDVLYVNSDVQKDHVFKQIDPEQNHTKLIQHEHSAALEQFPQHERTVRKATVAYNAAREIEQVIYTGDVGLFKPWQFEHSLTKPVTLKTTYDELKILWREEAKIRPEFKVADNNVYVPNLFAKIRGTHKELPQYWHDYRELATAGNTYVITSVPFTKVSYSKRDLYASAFLFNSSGLIDREKLFQSEFYRFSYLKTALQEFIINKTDELIKADVFINSGNDKELRLKILMAVLTMDDRILRLIETFDFPAEVPKLIIYDGTKDIFSDEDAIIIAFLNLVGIDIAIFTPTNYNNLELKLKEELLDVHQLPAVQLDLPVPDFADLPAEENKLSAFLNNVSQKIRRKFH